MIVYRVESFRRKGVYRIDGALPLTCTSPRHPSFMDDPIIGPWWSNEYPSEQWYFCFESMEKLKLWFGGDEMDSIASYNSKNRNNTIGISTYDVRDEDVKHGEKQSVFLLHSSQRLTFDPIIAPVSTIAK